MITVLTWLWSQPGGRTNYTVEHVNIWAAMVRRHLSIPHAIACVTDMPNGLDGRVKVIAPPRDFEDVRIPTWGEQMPQCLRRIALFRPDASDIFGQRFVSMDLDCVISDSLDPIFDRDDDFVMYRGTHASRPYNGSMVMMTAGARPKVYDDFTVEGAVEAGKAYLGSDQAWISHVLGSGEATWGVADGVHAWRSQFNDEHPRVTFFLSKEKPWDFARAGEAFVSRHYRGDDKRSCLILGYDPSVWDDAQRALRGGAFDVVIASPEAADHWPGDVFCVANTDAEAERIAEMHGFERVVFCGRSEELAA